MGQEGGWGKSVQVGEELVSAWPWGATFHPAWPHMEGGPRLEAQGGVDKGPAPPKLTPVNVSIVCKRSERTYCLCSYVCAPLCTPTAQAGGLWAGLFFLAALLSFQLPRRFQAFTGPGF